MTSFICRKRALTWPAVLLGPVLLALLSHTLILREIASFLVVEDPLQPAAAIISLAGQTPFREIEAAKLYHAGWAPAIIIARQPPNEETNALRVIGIKGDESWEVSREVLLTQRIPLSGIKITDAQPGGTLEELKSVYAALEKKDAPVILVTSRYHSRRVWLTWNYVTGGRSHAIVRAATRDPFDPNGWWRNRQFVSSVLREYLGLVNYYLGFPIPAGIN